MAASRSEPAAAAAAAGLDWQRPNNTEGTAWERIQPGWSHGRQPQPLPGYIGFPWASWIDAVHRGLIEPEPPLQLSAASAPRATVCQHIWALNHLDAFRAAGITDLFWSHACEDEHGRGGVRIHPFPLFPVRCSSHPPPEPLPRPTQRPLLYAYQGFHPAQGYPSEVRRWLQQLPPQHDALIEQRDEWHFEQQVYREQVHGLATDPQRHRQLAEEAQSYAQAMCSCVFALCPAGAGPNSIRLWEALGYGAIPVILADSLRLPGPAELWREAALRVSETAAAVAELPRRLAALRREPERLEAMQTAGRRLWQRYGPGDFIADVVDFLDATDVWLHDQALRRLGGDATSVLVARDPEALPLQVRRWLQSAPAAARLLIRIDDPRAPALQELLWGTPGRLAAAMLNRHPDIHWQICCHAPAIEALATRPPALSGHGQPVAPPGQSQDSPWR